MYATLTNYLKRTLDKRGKSPHSCLQPQSHLVDQHQGTPSAAARGTLSKMLALIYSYFHLTLLDQPLPAGQRFIYHCQPLREQ